MRIPISTTTILSAFILSGCFHAGVPMRPGRLPADGGWRVALNITLPGMASGPTHGCPRQYRGQPPSDDSACWRSTSRMTVPLGGLPNGRAGLFIAAMGALIGMTSIEVGHTIGRTEWVAHMGMLVLGAEMRRAVSESTDRATAVEVAVFSRLMAAPITRVGVSHSLGETGGLLLGGHLALGPQLSHRQSKDPYLAPWTLRLTGVLGGFTPRQLSKEDSSGGRFVGGLAPYLDYSLEHTQWDIGGHPLLSIQVH